MNAVSVVEEARIPVEVENIVEAQNALVIYPKHPIVKHSGAETKENTYKSNICYTASLSHNRDGLMFNMLYFWTFPK